MKGETLCDFTHSGLRWWFLANSQKLGDIFFLIHHKKILIAFITSYSPSLMCSKLVKSFRERPKIQTIYEVETAIPFRNSGLRWWIFANAQTTFFYDSWQKGFRCFFASHSPSLINQELAQRTGIIQTIRKPLYNFAIWVSWDAYFWENRKS